jgi:hypothetical protein
MNNIESESLRQLSDSRAQALDIYRYSSLAEREDAYTRLVAAEKEYSDAWRTSVERNSRE